MRVVTSQEYKDYLEHLKSLRVEMSPENQLRHKRIINTNYELLHIKMATLRSLAKSIAKDGYGGIISYSNNTYYEDVMIHGLIIGEINDKNKVFDLLNSYKDLIDCWALTDSITANMKAFKKGITKNDFNKFREYAKSDKEFVARLGLVLIFQYALTEEYLKDVLDLLRSIKNHAYYVDMMVAWTLAEIVAKFEKIGIKELQNKYYTKFIQNKAISKCRDSFRVDDKTKELLVSYRIK